MHDLELKRMIHVAAAGALALSVVNCGGKKKEDEDEPAPTKAEALGEYCDATRICEEDEFYSQYDDVDACVEESSRNYDEVVAQYGEECGESMLGLLDCVGQEWAETCDQYAAAEECLVEALVVSSDCEELAL